MMRFRNLVIDGGLIVWLFADVLGLGISQARAQQPDMKVLVKQSIEWIAQNSDYRDVEPPRNWAQLDEQAMANETVKRRIDPRTTAFYECSSQTMFFRSDIDLTRVAVQSSVLHETVHHAQCVNHRLRGDLCGMEREAYGLQARWLRAQAAKYSSEADRRWVLDYADGREREAARACNR